MIPYLGDFNEDATVYHYFNTFDSNDPSASVTITDLADTDIFVYKDGSVTDLVTDGASVVIDFDSRTGVHKLTIDTSAHADYATGSDYMVLVNGTTVDAGTITAAICSFSIENRHTATAIAALSTKQDSDMVVVATATTTIASDTAAIEVDTSTTLSAQVTTIASDLVKVYSDTTHIDSDTTAIALETTVIASDTVAIEALVAGSAIADAVWDETLTGANHNASTSAGRRLRQLDAGFIITEGTADAGSTSTTINLETGVADATTDDIYAGDRVTITAGTGIGEHGLILSYASSTQIATMSKAWSVTPDNTSEYILIPADCDVELWNDNAVTGDGDWAKIQSDAVVITADIASLSTKQDSDMVVVAADHTKTQSDVALIVTDGTLSVTLADGVTHGGSSALIQFGSSSGSPAVSIQGSSTGAGLQVIQTNNYPAILVDSYSGTPHSFNNDGRGVQIHGTVAEIDADITGNIETDIASLSTKQDSDMVVVAAATTTIASDLVLVYSDTTHIDSDVTAIALETTTIASDLVLVYSDTTHIDSDVTAIALETTTIASDLVLAQTDLDTITSDTALLETARGEPAQGAPGVSVDVLTKIDYLYKAWRNKKTQTATTVSVFDDSGATVDQKATISDDGTTATVGEIATGP